eukprot:TRINITY_DN8452_c0_g1_i4.p2 TRINITY_DN8452_c0_g1~~TRINITY_DN8452_c0_g1_i4.p2  ORF type:complete len:199 (-),score=46.93 TRINITY_DN8452_c0_g1_i4:328-924(-)
MLLRLFGRCGRSTGRSLRAVGAGLGRPPSIAELEGTLSQSVGSESPQRVLEATGSIALRGANAPIFMRSLDAQLPHIASRMSRQELFTLLEHLVLLRKTYSVRRVTSETVLALQVKPFLEKAPPTEKEALILVRYFHRLEVIDDDVVKILLENAEKMPFQLNEMLELAEAGIAVAVACGPYVVRETFGETSGASPRGN